MSSLNKCNIQTQGGGDWRCLTCGIVGDKDEEPGQFCLNKQTGHEEASEPASDNGRHLPAKDL